MSKATKPVSHLAQIWMKNPEFRAEYDALSEEFTLAEAMIAARNNRNLTQEDVARHMQTSRTAVIRLEGGTGNPSLNTLKRFARATGTKLRISFEPEC